MKTPCLHQVEFGGLLSPVTGESLTSLRHSQLALTQLSESQPLPAIQPVWSNQSFPLE